MGSTSWAMTTSWAFFCSTRLVTWLIPYFSTMGFFPGATSCPSLFFWAISVLCVCVCVWMCKVCGPFSLYFLSLVPRPLPDFISLPIFLHGCEIKSGSGLGTRLLFSYCNVYMLCMHIPTINMQLSIAFDADARKVEHHGGDHEWVISAEQ